MTIADVKAPYCLELVHYKTIGDTDPTSFIAINRKVGEEFTSRQQGFLHREIGHKDDGTWLIAVFWKTSEDAKNSIANIDNIPDTVKKYMSMIDLSTISRVLYEIV
jgi:hypothetical protein